MLEGIPRISVYIITYNQEDIIDRTLGSILSQRDYVYEICISDDCSSDKTWEILNNYSNNYPGLFKLNRNDPNLGIFENTEKVWAMPSGDIVYDLAGDDSVGEGWFKKVVDYINENNIDYKNELFCIYGDYKVIYPHGDSYVFHQKPVVKYTDALRLALRGIITNRSTCYSINILKKFDRISQGRSHIVESAQDRMLQLYAKKNYYLSYIGNIYFARIGVSVHIDKDTYKERLQIWPFTVNFLESKGIVLCIKDNNFGKFLNARSEFWHNRSLKNLFVMLRYFIVSRDFSMPIGDSFRVYVFALLRRLPHKKPLRFK